MDVIDITIPGPGSLHAEGEVARLQVHHQLALRLVVQLQQVEKDLEVMVRLLDPGHRGDDLPTPKLNWSSELIPHQAVLHATVVVDSADLPIPTDHLLDGALLDPRVDHLQHSLPVVEADRLNKTFECLVLGFHLDEVGVGLVAEQLEAALQGTQVGADGRSPDLQKVSFLYKWIHFAADLVIGCPSAPANRCSGGRVPSSRGWGKCIQH